jgi:hypothetical protein
MGDRRDQLEEDDDIESTAASAALSSSDHHFYKTDEVRNTLEDTILHMQSWFSTLFWHYSHVLSAIRSAG